MRIWPLILCCGVFCGHQVGIADEAQKKPEEFHFTNGLVVTSVPRPPDDLARLMDAHLWTFKLQFTSPIRGLEFSWQVREKGKAPLYLGSAAFINPDFEPFDLTAGMVPLEMELSKSKQLKFSYWSDKFSSYGSHPNPFVGALSSEFQNLEKFDDAISLMRVDMRAANAPKIGASDTRQLTLVLQIKILPVKAAPVKKSQANKK